MTVLLLCSTSPPDYVLNCPGTWTLTFEDFLLVPGKGSSAEQCAWSPALCRGSSSKRLEDYYRRNFKEYFEFVEGSVRSCILS
ncbi:hypothetical protein M758_1G004100 [Ceratodon purpureus]|nr:hypothetical protein M758_1G004100 [Ceratodon purpureus]